MTISYTNNSPDQLEYLWLQPDQNIFFDQSIESVSYIDNDPAKGALITIRNKGKMILPAIVKVIQTNGEAGTIQLPVEVWQRGSTWTFKYPSKTKIDKVILDPDNVLPDADRKNNEWNKDK